MERACTPTTSPAVIDIGGRNGISSSVLMCNCEVLSADTTTHVSHHAYKGNIPVSLQTLSMHGTYYVVSMEYPCACIIHSFTLCLGEVM